MHRFIWNCGKCYLANKLNINYPAFISFKLLYRCNLRCSYCNLWKSKSSELQFSLACKIIDQIAEMGIPIVYFSGGEPLLWKDIEIIGSYSKSKGIYTILNTNGTLIEDSNASRISESFNQIRISLNG
jgi:Fe-coproporphyrin III synthase